MAITGAGGREALIEFQVGTEAQDPVTRTTVIVWSRLRRAYAKARQPSGTDAFKAQQMVAKVDAIFRCRWQDARDVSATATFSVLWQGRRYDITAVIPPESARLRTELDVYAFARAESVPTTVPT